MTTTAQVKTAMQPLLARNPDLALVGRMVVIKPVHHILRGIFVDRCSAPELFIPTWATIFLFEPRASFSFNWGGTVYKPTPGLWDINDADVALAMCEEFERTALPLLRPIQTVDDFAEFTTHERFPHTSLDLYPLRKIVVDVARGDFASARTLALYLMTDKARRRFAQLLAEEHQRVTSTICPLLVADDRAGLARLLHEWEEWSVRKIKLEKLWQQTPFPLEAMV